MEKRRQSSETRCAFQVPRREALRATKMPRRHPDAARTKQSRVRRSSQKHLPAFEAEHRMKLNAIGRNACLSVDEVEEANASDRRRARQIGERACGGVAAGPHEGCSCSSHLLACRACRVQFKAGNSTIIV